MGWSGTEVYVRYQIPVGAAGNPVTFIHGCCLTGKTWETTPDGRMGWDEYFVRKGRGVYVIDQASRGRSAANLSAINRVKTGKTAADQLPPVFAVSHEEACDAQAELWKQLVPDWIESLPTPNPTVPALSELAQRLNRTVLISHSQSGIYPFQTAALSTTGIAGIVAIEPAACPTATGGMGPYTKTPILVLFGDYVDRSPFWAARLRACREFVQVVNKSGGHAQLVALPDAGFHGNSHMLMQDKNSLEVADWLLAWIDRNIERQRPN